MSTCISTYYFEAKAASVFGWMQLERRGFHEHDFVLLDCFSLLLFFLDSIGFLFVTTNTNTGINNVNT